MKKSAATAGSLKSFALGLKSDLVIADKLKANTITYQLGTAMEVIKTAYMTLTHTSLKQLGPVNQRALNSYSAALGTLGK